MSERSHTVSVSLDALALISCAFRSDFESGNLLLETYSPNERGELFVALVAHCVCLLRAASEASGVAPEKFLGGLATSIRELEAT